MNVYADTSALVKLVVKEQESRALHEWITSTKPTIITNDLARTELLRAVRKTAPGRLTRARAVLDATEPMTIPTEVFDQAGVLAPDHLRSLDAIHIASALTLGDDLHALVAYDIRILAAAHAHGLRTVTPS